MPVLSATDAEKLSPLFRGKAGHALFAAVARLTAVDRVNALHDRVEARCPYGPPFAKGLLDDLGIDSLEVVDVVVLVEDQFGYKMQPEDFKTLQTLDQFCEFIQQHID